MSNRITFTAVTDEGDKKTVSFEFLKTVGNKVQIHAYHAGEHETHHVGHIDVSLSQFNKFCDNLIKQQKKINSK